MTTEAAGCTGKVRYLDKAEARRVRRKMASGGQMKGKLSAYVCEFCGFYHLGHMPQAVRNGTVDKQTWKSHR